MTRWVVRLGSVRGEGAYVVHIDRPLDRPILVWGNVGRDMATRYPTRESAAQVAAEVGGRVVRLRRKT